MTKDLNDFIEDLNKFERNQKLKELGIVPINLKSGAPKRIIFDISYFPKEYKDLGLAEAINKYNSDYNVSIIPVDGSRHNTSGNSSPILHVFQ